MSKHKILVGCLFVISGLMVGATFLTATSYFQLAVGILLYPILALFFFVAFPRGIRIVRPEGSMTASWPPARSAEETRAKEDSIGIIDVDKRAFLKLLGGAGLALFLFSIFNRKIEGLLFRNLPASDKVPMEANSKGENDSIQTQPTNSYSISEIDDDIIAFYGFTNKDGAWYIMQEDTNAGSFRYAKGDSDFPGNWSNRAKLQYDYYSNVFKF